MESTIEITSTSNGNIINHLSNGMGVEYKEYFGNPKFKIQGWLFSHATIRRMFTLVENKLNNNGEWSKPKSRDNIEMMVKVIKQADIFLQHHHDIEEELVWPWLHGLIPESKQILDDMDVQHHEWEELSKQMHSILDRFTNDKTIFNLTSDNFTLLFDQLKQVHTKIVNILMFHLADEERLIMPLITRIPIKEQQNIEGKVKNQNKKSKDALFSICAMVDCAKNDPIIQQEFDIVMPWIIRKVLTPLFNKKNYKWFIDELI